MGANTNRLSPRQKMINLMYIVLTAMLALNVSSDVLDGFTQVHEGLNRSNTNYGQRNNAIYGELESLAAKTPTRRLRGSKRPMLFAPALPSYTTTSILSSRRL